MKWSEDIVKRMEGVNDPEDWSPCSDFLFYKHLNDANFVLNQKNNTVETILYFFKVLVWLLSHGRMSSGAVFERGVRCSS